MRLLTVRKCQADKDSNCDAKITWEKARQAEYDSGAVDGPVAQRLAAGRKSRAAVPDGAHDAAPDTHGQPDQPNGSHTDQPCSTQPYRTAGDRGDAHAGWARGDTERDRVGDRRGDEPNTRRDAGDG